jgi:hypothetical protein
MRGKAVTSRVGGSATLPRSLTPLVVQRRTVRGAVWAVPVTSR